MCGIAAIVEFGSQAPSTAALDQLSKSLAHRGPDDEGRLVYKNVGMVFRRLAIIDLSKAGHQPMHCQSGRYVIIFNGEIFNYLELRKELEIEGYTFRSHSDTEVLLNAYIEWKESCLNKLNGMWAFIILDKDTGECFCARDRFGVKPLYYFKTQARIIFSSEIKAIKHSGLYDAQVNLTSVSRYLFYDELDCTDETFYEGINAVSPGSYMKIDAAGRIQIKRYWEIPDEKTTNVDHKSLYALFFDSVNIRLRSDVPVGVFLSGGLDSTSILCAAARQLGNEHPVHAYSFMPAEFDESRYINDTVNQTGATLTALQVSDSDLWNQLGEMLKFQDAPVHSPSALIGFCLSRLASQHGTKVILNGQGADETFAGYPSYFKNFWYTLLADTQVGNLLRQLNSYGAHHGVATARLLSSTLVAFFKTQMNRIHAYRKIAAASHARALGSHPFYSTALVRYLPDYAEDFHDMNLHATLKRAILAQPLPLYLRVEDRNSMASSIEIRLPFLDYRLVTAIMSVFSVQKLEGFWNKAILRETMKGAIPESVRTRPDKMGFATPDAKWIRKWSPEIEEIFRSPEFAERKFFNVPSLLKALEDQFTGIRDSHVEIFKALQVELCLQSVSAAI